MSTPLSPLEIGAVLAGLRIAGTDLYSRTKKVLGNAKQKWDNASIIRGLTSQVQTISQVKTLLCLEQPRPLTEFYAEQRVHLPDGNLVTVSSMNDLSSFHCLVMSGVAGQGKSMLFRYLVLREIQQHKVPIFAELRHYANFGRLNDQLLHEIANLGFDHDPKVLNAILMMEESSVFLDAFDEIPPAMQPKARKEIDDLCRQYPQLKVCVSTRPSLTIESSHFFRVARIAYLRRDDAIDALRVMCSDSDDVHKIAELIRATKSKLTELLTTPLMVALLLLHYRLTGEFPETEQAFFGDLFDVLLRRHDQTKGYIRQRYSTASEIELSEVFAYLSFVLRKSGAVEASRDRFVSESDKAMKYHGRQFDAAGAVDDIIHGTNLLLEEGTVCRYAHKSVQEFYAAKFLLAQSEDNISRFLTQRVRKWGDWEQMIQFIGILNRYMFIKHFLAPHIGWIAFKDEGRRVDSGWIPANRVYDDVFGDDVVYVDNGQVKLWGPSHHSSFYPFRDGIGDAGELFEFLKTVDWKDVEKDSSVGNGQELNEILLRDYGNIVPFTFRHLLSQPVGGELRAVLRSRFDKVVPRILAAYEFVDHRVSQSDLFG